MSNVKEKQFKRGKKVAWLGMFLMAIGSFASCLGTTTLTITIGTIILVTSLVVTTYGFYYWQP